MEKVRKEEEYYDMFPTVFCLLLSCISYLISLCYVPLNFFMMHLTGEGNSDVDSDGEGDGDGDDNLDAVSNAESAGLGVRLG